MFLFEFFGYMVMFAVVLAIAGCSIVAFVVFGLSAIAFLVGGIAGIISRISLPDILLFPYCFPLHPR